MRPAAIVGLILLLGGALAFVVPGITYRQHQHSMDIGPLHASATTREVWPVPRALALIAIGAGVVLLATGVRRT